MIYRNTFKSLQTNFHLVWKILLYISLTTLVIIGLAYASALPILKVLSNNGFMQEITEMFNDYSVSFNLYEFIRNLLSVTELFFDLIITNLSSLWYSIILFLLVVVLLQWFLIGFYTFSATDVLYNQLSSNIKSGFTTSFFSSFKKNMLYQLTALITVLPVNVAIFTALYFISSCLVSSSTLAIASPFLIMISFVILISLKITIFSAWVPSIVVLNCGIFSGLFKGLQLVSKKFFKVWGTSIAIVLTLLVVNMSIFIITFGVGVIIALPLSFLTILIFNMMIFYFGCGMRFYSDHNNIVATKKIEKVYTFKQLKKLYKII